MESATVKGKMKLAPRVVSATPQSGRELLIVFDNGERRVFDASPLLECPAFRPLASLPFFQSVRVECGTIAWPHGIDYCPDTLYSESRPV